MYEEKWCNDVAEQIAENLNSDSVRFDEDVLLNSGGQIRYVEIYQKDDGEERLIDLSATYRNAKYVPPEVAAQLVEDQIMSEEEPKPLMDTESYDLVKGHLNYFLISRGSQR